MIIYLYVKTHNTTGLKYLGTTTKADPHLYTGSGVYWKKHLKKHGKNYTTEIIKESNFKEEIKKWGLYYSSLWNVVESKEWANLKEEAGNGEKLSNKIKQKLSSLAKGKSYEERYGIHTATIMREKLKKRKISLETKQKMSSSKKKYVGEQYSKFNGYYYITPWGNFPSSKIAAENFPGKSITEDTIRNWCIKINNKELSNHTISRNNYFCKLQKGLTFNQIGFDYKKL